LGVTIVEPFNVSFVPTPPATIDIEVGVPGASASVTVGTTTTLDPGLNATVTNVGTATNAILDFGIPRGEQGIQGIQGPKGDTGDSGVAYATSPLSYDSGTKTISIDLSAYATQSFVTSQGYITISALTPYLTSVTAAATYYPLSNPEGYITVADLSGYATESWVISQNYLTSADLSGYATESWVTSQGYLTDAPSDTYGYVRKAGAWSYSPKFYEVQVGAWTNLTSGQYLINDGSYVTNMTAAAISLTDTLGAGMFIRNYGLEFPDATTQTTAGLSPATAATTYYPLTNPSGFIADAPSDGTTYGRKDGAWSAVVSSVAWGSITGTLSAQTDLQTALNAKAPLASPTFTGDPKSVTPLLTDNDTSIATTAYVKGQGYLTAATASGTYYPLTNPSNFIIPNGTTSIQVTGGTVKSIDGSDNFVQLNQTALEFGNGTTAFGLSVNGTGITFADATIQTTAGIGDAPSDGSTYGRNNGAWVISGGGSGSGTLTYSSGQLYDTSTAFFVADLTLSGTLSAGTVTGGSNATLNSSGLTLAASSGAVITFADATTQSTAPHDIPSGGTTGQVLAKNSATDYDVSWVAAGGGGGGGHGVDIQTFGSSTTSGTFTWTKPAHAKLVKAFLMAGGSGGGSGARYATTSGRSGGGGGNSGNVNVLFINADNLGSTETVTIGAGGAGGASRTIDSSNGTVGTTGGFTSFSLYKVIAGAGGNGGGTGTTPGGGSNSSFAYGFLSFQQGTAGSGLTSNGNPASSSSASRIGTAGGGGGGAAALSTTNSSGGAGGIMNSNSNLVTAIAGGTGGTIAGVQATAGTSSNGFTISGTGGGGGFYRTGQAGGTGGNGGWPSGGGGGGGASDNGFASGAGGAGANGYAIIITYT
jgi:hypothetical protein